MEMFNFGGGCINNNGRFVDGNGQSAGYGESISLEEIKEASTLHFIENNKKIWRKTIFPSGIAR
jgi:hypothetical protein